MLKGPGPGHPESHNIAEPNGPETRTLSIKLRAPGCLNPQTLNSKPHPKLDGRSLNPETLKPKPHPKIDGKYGDT